MINNPAKLNTMLTAVPSTPLSPASYLPPGSAVSPGWLRIVSARVVSVTFSPPAALTCSKTKTPASPLKGYL